MVVATWSSTFSAYEFVPKLGTVAPLCRSTPDPLCRAAQPLSRFAEAIMAPTALVMSKAFFTSVVTSKSKLFVCAHHTSTIHIIIARIQNISGDAESSHRGHDYLFIIRRHAYSSKRSKSPSDRDRQRYARVHECDRHRKFVMQNKSRSP